MLNKLIFEKKKNYLDGAIVLCDCDAHVYSLKFQFHPYFV